MHRIVKAIFQPIVDIKTGKVSHFEALSRMRDGSGRHGKLIDMGEAFGYIPLIDEAIAGESLLYLSERPCLRIAVNVSVQTVEHSLNNFLALLFRHMECTGRLVVEITETLNIRNFQRVDSFVRALRLLGVRLAIDDFGDGFFTADLVNKLRPDYLKLAESVFADLEKTGDPRHLLEVKKFADSIDTVLIAEHIDTDRKLALMQEFGVRYGQGFLFGRGDDVPDGGDAWCKNVGQGCNGVCAREVNTAKVVQMATASR